MRQIRSKLYRYFTAAVIPLLAFVTAHAKAPRPHQVRKISNIAYYQGKDADKVDHRLDVYVPKGARDFPVVFYAHGGGWTIGHKNQLGMPHLLGHSFAGRGVAFVSINYRLYPKTRHPGHIEDVARAFAWVHKNIGKYGGRSDEIFISGHSAGGHLVALLATNERFLKAHKLSLKDIRGVIGLSGVYTITGHGMFRRIFSEKSDVRRDASPIMNVSKKTPPTLLLFASYDFPQCDRPWAMKFHAQLVKHKVQARALEIPKRNHLTILWSAAASDDDPMNRLWFDFVVARVALHRMAHRGREGVDWLVRHLR